MGGHKPGRKTAKVEAPHEQEQKGGGAQKPEVAKQSELSPRAKEIVGEKEKAKKEAEVGMTGVKTDVLKRQMGEADPETFKRVFQLDVHKGLDTKEQKEGFEALKAVTATTLLAKFFQNGIAADVVGNFENLIALTETTEVKFNSNEKPVLAKLGQIARDSVSPLYHPLQDVWHTLVENAKHVYDAAQEVEKAITGASEAKVVAPKEGTATPLSSKEKKSEEPEKDPGLFEKAKDFVGEHPVLAAGIAVAGIYGLYRIFSEPEKPESGKPEHEKSLVEDVFGSKWGKRIKYGLGIGLGMFVLGQLAGSEGIGNWFKKHFNIDITDNRFSQFLALVSEGEILEALKVLVSGPEKNFAKNNKLAEIISKQTKQKVNPQTLNTISNFEYKNFISTVEQGKSVALEYINRFGKWLPIPFAGSTIESLTGAKTLAEEKVVRDYFKMNEAKIEALHFPEKATVFEVLTRLNNMQIESSPEKAGEKPDADHPDEVSDAGKGEAAGVSHDALKALQEQFKSKPNMENFFKKYDGKMAAEMWSATFWSDLFEACHKDSLGVIIKETGEVFIVDGEKFILFSSVKALGTLAKDVVMAPFSDKVGWSDVVVDYTKEVVPFMAIGAMFYGAKGALLKEGFMRGAIKGAGRGFIFPVEAARLHVRGGQWVYRNARGAEFTLKRFFSAAEMAPQILQKEAKFYAEVAQGYENLITARNNGKVWDLKKWYAKLSGKRIDELKAKYLDKFVSTYNDSIDAKRKIDPTFKEEHLKVNTSEERHEAMKRMKKFLDEKGKILGVKNVGISGGQINYEKTEGVGADALHSYKIGKTTVTLKEGNIAAKAAEIAQKGVAPNFQDLAKYPHGAQDVKFIEDIAKWNEKNWNEAIKVLSEEQLLTIVKTQGIDLEKLDDITRAKKLEEMSGHVESMASYIETEEKSVRAKFNVEVEKIVAEAKQHKLPLSSVEISAKLEKVDADLLVPFAQKKQASLEILFDKYKILPRRFKTPALKSQLRRAVEGVEGTRLTRFAKGIKGRAKMMTLMASAMFLTDQIIHRNDPERELFEMLEELGPEFGQLLVDCLPFVGTFSNYYSAFSGKELVGKEKDPKTGLWRPRDVSGGWDRASNAIWGTVGLAADIITVIGAIPTAGADIGANAVLRLTKEATAGSKTAAKLLKMWPRIERIAERMGGWYKFGKKLAKYMKLDSAVVTKGLRKIEKIGMVAGTGMLLGGATYHLYYGFVDNKTEMEIPEDIVSPSEIDEVPQQSQATG